MDNTFEDIYKQKYNFVKNIVRKRIKNIEDVEDVTQDVFLKVLRNKEKIKEIKCINTWLSVIAKNESITFLLKENRKKTIFKDVDQETVKEFQTNTLESHIEAAQTVSAILRNFSVVAKNTTSENKKLYIEKVFKEKTYKEISKSTGVKPECLRKRFKRINDRIRDIVI